MSPRTGPDANFWRDKTVLITGHTGFKGAWLSLWLRALGAQVAGLALAPESQDNLYQAAGLEKRMRSVIGDIRDGRTVERLMVEARPDVVFHLAAQSLVRPSYEDPVGTMATNVTGTINVLEAVRRVDSVRACLVVTSDKCYENREWYWPYRETDPVGGYDPYSASKGCAEIVTAAWRRSFMGAGQSGVSLASVRAGNVIGGGDWAVDRLLPDCARALSKGRPVTIRNPHATRPWQHVLEPLSGYLMLAQRLSSEERGREFAEAWNFGPALEDAQTVGWIVEQVVQLWGDGARWTAQPGEHPHEATFLAVDASKARVRLGWRPRLTLSKALDWTVQWYRDFLAGGDAEVMTNRQIARYQQLGGE